MKRLITAFVVLLLFAAQPVAHAGPPPPPPGEKHPTRTIGEIRDMMTMTDAIRSGRLSWGNFKMIAAKTPEIGVEYVIVDCFIVVAEGRQAAPSPSRIYFQLREADGSQIGLLVSLSAVRKEQGPWTVYRQKPTKKDPCEYVWRIPVKRPEG